MSKPPKPIKPAPIAGDDEQAAQALDIIDNLVADYVRHMQAFGSRATAQAINQQGYQAKVVLVAFIKKHGGKA